MDNHGMLTLLATLQRMMTVTEFLITLDIMLPLLSMLVVGWLLRRMNLMTEPVTQGLNKMVFKILLPVLLFNNMRGMDVSTMPNMAYAAFIGLGITAVYLVAQLIAPRFLKDVRQSAVMVQALFRTNFAILGVPLMLAIFGEAGNATVSLALPVAIPINNIVGVLALAPCSGKTDLKGTIKKILSNPLLWGIILGAIMMVLGNPLPKFADKVCKDVGSMTSTVSLLVLGASLRWNGVKANRVILAVGLVVKQLIVPFIMFGLAVLLGFRGMELGVIVILFGAPTAVSSFPMAQAMGGDGQLAGSMVALTTICSMGTLFLLIYLCKLAAFF